MVAFSLAEMSMAWDRLKASQAAADGGEKEESALEMQIPEPPAPPYTLPTALPLPSEREEEAMEGPAMMELLMGEVM